jgi:hypothetical protein
VLKQWLDAAAPVVADEMEAAVKRANRPIRGCMSAFSAPFAEIMAGKSPQVQP